MQSLQTLLRRHLCKSSTFSPKDPKDARIHERGQLLLEVLMVTAAAAVIIGLGGQIISVALRGTRTSADTNRAVSIANETFDAVRAASTEKWQNLYNLNKPSTQYYPAISGGKWVLSAGSEDVILDGITYTRFFTVENVSRDPNTRAIQTAYNGPSDDPSTQLVTVTVTWGESQSLIASEYIERWRNKICLQTQWTGVGAGPVNCPSTNFGSQTNMDISTPGAIKLSPQ